MRVIHLKTSISLVSLKKTGSLATLTSSNMGRKYPEEFLSLCNYLSVLPSCIMSMFHVLCFP